MDLLNDEMIGVRFGRLTVVSSGGKIGNQRAWICKCECGNTTRPIRGASLRRGDTQSCGCLRKERFSNYKHGGVGTRLYNIFKTMHRRCESETATKYPLYGGRGISVCEEWKNFDTFREWSLNNGYTDGLTIDRIDNNGDYSPSNCRWVSNKVQANNRRSNHQITYMGETHTLTRWSEITGIPRSKLSDRICKLRWSAEQALEGWSPHESNRK